jgi:hypothetical protein
LRSSVGSQLPKWIEHSCNRAIGWFQERGVTTERVLPDNDSCYKSHAWRNACADLCITHKAE